MDIILHIGAHRTGTTSFQDYMRRHSETLAQDGIGFWGPGRTRAGLLRCLYEDADTAETGCDALEPALDAARQRGFQRLVVSDENVLGSVRQNIRARQLYPEAGERIARVAQAFRGGISRVMISVRSLEDYWCSALSYGVLRGAAVPDRTELAEIAAGRRGWRDVLTDVSGGLPGAAITVYPFEQFRGRPDTVLADLTGRTVPFDDQRKRLNRSATLPQLRRALHERGASAAALPFGMERWNPFKNDEHAALRELHADDLMWLTAGADGCAKLTENGHHDRTGYTPSHGPIEKGQRDEFEERQMARPG